MGVCEHLDLLSGYMGTLPFFSQKVIIFNVQCLHPDQTIYQAEIRSCYRILYCVLEGEQTVEVRAPETEQIHLSENTVFQVGNGVPHRFIFQRAPRARMLVIYYKVVPQLRDAGDFEPFTKDEENLIIDFLRQHYSAFPIGRRMRAEIEMLNEYMSTRTCGDALKVRNQLSNIFLSSFQQNSYSQGKAVKIPMSILRAIPCTCCSARSFPAQYPESLLRRSANGCTTRRAIFSVWSWTIMVRALPKSSLTRA